MRWKESQRMVVENGYGIQSGDGGGLFHMEGNFVYSEDSLALVLSLRLGARTIFSLTTVHVYWPHSCCVTSKSWNDVVQQRRLVWLVPALVEISCREPYWALIRYMFFSSSLASL